MYQAAEKSGISYLVVVLAVEGVDAALPADIMEVKKPLQLSEEAATVDLLGFSRRSKGCTKGPTYPEDLPVVGEEGCTKLDDLGLLAVEASGASVGLPCRYPELLAASVALVLVLGRCCREGPMANEKRYCWFCAASSKKGPPCCCVSAAVAALVNETLAG